MLSLILVSALSLSGLAQAAPAETRWNTRKLITIPASFAASAQTDRSVAELRFTAIGGDTLTCYYSKFNGAFRIQDCRGPREERECFGAFRDWIGEELPARASAGDQVIADSVTLTLPACPKNAACAGLLALDAIGGQPGEACEGAATSNLHVLGDLTCGTSGFALRFNATGKRLEGYGHSIKAPSAMVGVFLTGSKIQVSRLKVNGVKNGIGLQAYNATRLVVQDSEFRDNVTGLNVYSDGRSPESVAILRNDLSNNSWVALRFNQDGGYGAVAPYLRGNKLANAGYFALWLDVKSVYLDGRLGNVFDGSTNGVFFVGGDAIVDRFDLSKSGIRSAGLFFNGNRTVFLTNSNLSSSVAGTPMQDRFGAHFYRVGSAFVDKLIVDAGDVGVKVATDGGVSTRLLLTNSRITKETVSALMVQSYDGTAFGQFFLQKNDFRANARDVWLVGSTVVGGGSDLIP